MRRFNNNNNNNNNNRNNNNNVNNDNVVGGIDNYPFFLKPQASPPTPIHLFKIFYQMRQHKTLQEKIKEPEEGKIVFSGT